MCVMSVLDVKKISTLLNMVGSTEQSVDFLQRYFLGFGNEGPYESSKEDVDGEGKRRRFCCDTLA
jgi:hypothetical protein